MSQKGYSGGLSPDRLLMLSRLSVMNGLQFILDSHVLLTRGSYGHSVALSVFAIEELGKGIYCYYASKGWTRVEEFYRYMTKHKRKHEVLESLDILYMMKRESEKIKKKQEPVSFEALGEVPHIRSRERFWEGLEDIRQLGLYVDYRGTLRSPLAFNKDTAQLFLREASYWGRVLVEVVGDSLLGGTKGSRKNSQSTAKSHVRAKGHLIARRKTG
jgi:AbiV family abortive infection protein